LSLYGGACCNRTQAETALQGRVASVRVIRGRPPQGGRRSAHKPPRKSGLVVQFRARREWPRDRGCRPPHHARRLRTRRRPLAAAAAQQWSYHLCRRADAERRPQRPAQFDSRIPTGQKDDSEQSATLVFDGNLAAPAVSRDAVVIA